MEFPVSTCSLQFKNPPMWLSYICLCVRVWAQQGNFLLCDSLCECHGHIHTRCGGGDVHVQYRFRCFLLLVQDWWCNRLLLRVHIWMRFQEITTYRGISTASVAIAILQAEVPTTSFSFELIFLPPLFQVSRGVRQSPATAFVILRTLLWWRPSSATGTKSAAEMETIQHWRQFQTIPLELFRPWTAL